MPEMLASDDRDKSPKKKFAKVVVQNKNDNNSVVVDVLKSKRILCPVCCMFGSVKELRYHMEDKHYDYLKKHDITSKTFQFIEALASNEHLQRDRFIAYQWPEYGVKTEWVKADLSDIKLIDYKAINFAFYLMRNSQTNVTISHLIQTLMLSRNMEQIKAYDFVKRCVEEGILKYDSMFYEFSEPDYLRIKIFYTSFRR